MKTLFVLRHAKSSWSDANLADFDRPLNARGLKAAPFMGGLMRSSGFEPTVILSSPAQRARQTAAAVKAGGELAGEIRFDDRIYEASPQGLRQVVSELGNEIASVLLVGHNPGMEGFIRFLTGAAESMPTAALAVITLDIDGWESIADGRGRLEAIYRPRDEMAKQAPGQ